MTKEVLVPGLGNWVDGEKFFNRDVELELLTERLRNGESISLVAQRRIGKTSLMREAARRLGDDAISIHVDFEKSATPQDALVELAVALKPHDTIWGSVSKIVAGGVKAATEKLEEIKISELSVSLRNSISEDDWRQKGDEIFASLAATADHQGKVVVLFLDEVPILVSRLLNGPDNQMTNDRRTQTDIFMSWLRDNALRHNKKIAVVVTGSIGLEPLLNQAGLNGTLNAYQSFELQPWSPETAAKCLMALAAHRKLPITQEIANYMISRLGCAIPHHVQMFFDHVEVHCRMNEIADEISIENIDQVYETSMTGLRGHPELSHMEERLRTILSNDQFASALEILTEASVVGEVSPETAITICSKQENSSNPRYEMNALCAILEHDGYILRNNGTYHFESTLLRDWWKNRFGNGYQPIGEKV